MIANLYSGDITECNTVLIDLFEYWKQNLDDGRPDGVVSLDLSKAFDSLPRDILLAKLSGCNLSQESLRLMEKLIVGRRKRVKILDTSSE